jgi:hypothetical protein
MLGLFQGNLPIAQRLWVLVVTLVVAGTLAYTPIAETYRDPIDFTIELLLLFGQAFFITFWFLFILGIPVYFLESEISYRADKSSFYRHVEVPERILEQLFSLVEPFIFVIVVAEISPNFGDTMSHFQGQVGLFLYLFSLLLGSIQHSTPKRHTYLLFEQISNNFSKAVIVTGSEKQLFTVTTDWFQALSYLGDNEWELVDIHMGVRQQIDISNKPRSKPSDDLLESLLLSEVALDHGNVRSTTHKALFRKVEHLLIVETLFLVYTKFASTIRREKEQ